MACHKCHKEKCCCPKNNGSLEAQVADLQKTIDKLSKEAKFLLCGHPILILSNPDDVEMFDTDTGLGSECWEGWALCDGQTQKTAAGKNIETPNLIDRFVTMAGGAYTLGGTGGLNTVTLDVTQIPSHNHTLTDPGHTHGITDPGHKHNITDAGHTHTNSPHAHDYGDEKPCVPNVGSLLANFTGGGDDTLGDVVSNKTSEYTSVVINTAMTGVTVNTDHTGVTVNTAETGMSIAAAGGGLAHENRPPFYAAIYVMKLS